MGESSSVSFCEAGISTAVILRPLRPKDPTDADTGSETRRHFGPGNLRHPRATGIQGILRFAPAVLAQDDRRKMLRPEKAKDVWKKFSGNGQNRTDELSLIRFVLLETLTAG
jgi:hypothetical protein